VTRRDHERADRGHAFNAKTIEEIAEGVHAEQREQTVGSG
jgi:hypothetical protein